MSDVFDVVVSIHTYLSPAATCKEADVNQKSLIKLGSIYLPEDVQEETITTFESCTIGSAGKVLTGALPIV